jgi:hypothetical protein
MRQDKFLVEFVSHLTKKDLFIGAWVLGAALFSYMMWSYSKNSNRRNFREQETGTKKAKSATIQSENSKAE